MTIQNQILNDFSDLFAGGDHAYGRADGGSVTVKEPLLLEQYRQHLKGEMSLGVIPIRKSGWCSFGAIDLDLALDFEELENAIKKLDIPALVLRSKSGGVHLYTFFSGMGIQALELRSLLDSWLPSINEELDLFSKQPKYKTLDEIEIFPKQNHLNEAEGKGNWINIPYYSIHHETMQCTRVAFIDGEYRDIEYFIEKAKEITKRTEGIADKFAFKNSDAPPCLKPFLDRKEKVREGHGNYYIHQCAIYFKKENPEITTEELTIKLQAEGAHALVRPEYKLTFFSDRAKGVVKNDWNYSCNNMPLCNRIICGQLDKGYKAHQTLKEDKIGDVYAGQLTKVLTDPPIYNWFIGSQEISLSAEELANPNKFRLAAMSKIDILLPLVKPKEWEKYINEKMRKLEYIEAPEDAGEEGVIKGLLREFASTANVTNLKSQKEVLAFFKNNRAVKKTISGEEYVIFKGPAFERWCRDNKSTYSGKKNVWNIARKIGFECRTVSIDGEKHNCWMINTSKLDFKAIDVDDINDKVRII